MRIILAQICSYPPEIGKTDIFEYAQSLLKLGHSVYLICGQKNDNQSSQDNLKVISLNLPLQESLTVSWKYAFAFYKQIVAIHRSSPVDVVHILNPFFLAFICLKLIWLRNLFHKEKIKTIFDVRTGPIRRGYRKWLSRSLMRLASFFADRTTVLDRSLAQHIFGDKNTVVLPLGVNQMLFTPKPETRASQRHKLGFRESDFVFIYSGSMDRRRALKALIQGFILASNNFHHIKLLMIGDGNDRVDLKKYAQKKLPGYIEFSGQIPYQKMPEFLQMADVALSYIPQKSYYEYQPPLKTPEYLATGLPVLATNTSGNKVFIKDGWNGVIINDTPEEILRGITKIIATKDSLRKNTRSDINRFSWDTIVNDKLVPEYLSLTGRY
ncbi:glycosyltransferase [Patescibacteria group bacterium]|nr:glycosyltransferase [Patescibacteria group bacterium]MBU1890857.1 glycosyltransferase [Patescibacteria group bacterium]